MHPTLTPFGGRRCATEVASRRGGVARRPLARGAVPAHRPTHELVERGRKAGTRGITKRNPYPFPQSHLFSEVFCLFFCIERYDLKTTDSSVKRGLTSKGVVDKQAGVLKGTASPFIPKKSDCYSFVIKRETYIKRERNTIAVVTS